MSKRVPLANAKTNAQPAEKRGARLVVTAGLGLALALGAAPVVALAEGETTAPAASTVESADETDEQGTTDVTTGSITIEGEEGTTYYDSLQDAVAAASEGGTVKLLDDVTLSSRLAITQNNVTIDLNDHKVSAASDFMQSSNHNDNQLVSIDGATGVTIKNGTIETGANNCHALNVWNSQGVTLEDLKLDHDSAYRGAPLVVGASDVTVSGELDVVTGKNSWYGINVDSRNVNEEAEGSSLTFYEGANVFFSGSQPVGIYAENSVNDNVVVSFGKGATISSDITGLRALVNADGASTVFDNPDNAGLDQFPDGTFGHAVAVIDSSKYATLDEALNAAAEGQTITLEADAKLSERLAITQNNVTIDLNDHKVSAASDFMQSSNHNDNQLVSIDGATGVTIKNGTIETGANNCHALNVWNSQGVTLEDLKLDHDSAYRGAPLVVGASDVTVSGELDVVTGKNSWYGINVDSRNVNEEAEGSSLTFYEGANVSFSGSSQIGIYAENSVNDNVVVSFGKGATISSDITGLRALVNADGASTVFENTDNAGLEDLGDGIYGKAAAHIKERGYLTIDEALDAAQDGDTIVIAAGEHAGDITLDKGVKNLTITGAEGAVIKDGSIKVGSGALDLSGLTISNLGFKNANIKMSPSGGCDLSGMTIENNTFEGAHDKGLAAIHLNVGSKTGGLSGAEWSGLSITGNSISNIKSGNSSGIVIIDDGAGGSDVSISGNTIDGVAWNGIQLNTVKGGDVVIEGNTIRDCGASGGDGVINLYGTTADSFAVNRNKIYPGEGQLYVSYVSDDADLSLNYWGTAAPDFERGISFKDAVAPSPEVVTDPYYKADAMRPEDLSTYRPPVPSTPSAPTYDVEVPESEGGKVAVSDASPEEGDEVTVTATPDEGQEVREVVVTDAEGNEIEVTPGEDGTYTFEMPKGDVTVEVTFGCDGGELCPTHSYADLDQAEWYHDAVDWAVTSGAILGYGDGTFGPGNTLTRAEMATILCRLAGEPEADLEGLPSDVPATEWYANGVAWALAEGVFNGNGDGSFDPAGAITREQAACVLYNRAQAAGEDVSARADLSAFADADELSGWAEEAMSWAVAEGVFSGGAAGLEPGRALTRSEGAAILWNWETRAE